MTHWTGSPPPSWRRRTSTAATPWGCFGGGGLTNEKAYQFGKFARVALGTSAIDYNGRFCMSSAANAATRVFGIDRGGLPFPLADLAEADLILLVGSNPADTMPPAMQFIDTARERGARLIVIDPRTTKTAAGAFRHLQPVPGTDLALANGMLNIAVREKLIDDATSPSGPPASRPCAARYAPTGPTGSNASPAFPNRTSPTPSTPSRAPSTPSSSPPAAPSNTARDRTPSWPTSIWLWPGLPGRKYCGYGTITGQGNGQGGREHGQKADQLPGYRRLDDPAARAHVAAVWGGIHPDELPQPGLSAYEMLDHLGTDDASAPCG